MRPEEEQDQKTREEEEQEREEQEEQQKQQAQQGQRTGSYYRGGYFGGWYGSMLGFYYLTAMVTQSSYISSYHGMGSPHPGHPHGLGGFMG
jgi:hypothetical protein